MLCCAALCLQLSKQLQRLQQRLSRSSVEQGSVSAYDSPTSVSAAGAADAFKPGLDTMQQRSAPDAAAADDGPFAGVQYPQNGAYVSKAYAAANGSSAAGYGQVPAKGWYLHACVIMAALGVRWWLLNQTDPLQRKVMLVIIWPVSEPACCADTASAIVTVSSGSNTCTCRAASVPALQQD